eukprot:scaffold18450_cov68-Phaeocystis_antarctica.AAC.2
MVRVYGRWASGIIAAGDSVSPVIAFGAVRTGTAADEQEAHDRANDDADERPRGEPVVRRRRRAVVALVRRLRQGRVGLEPRRQLLDLAVLHVDDAARQALGEIHVLVLRARRRVVCSRVVLQERLGHRHGVLVVRDHLAREGGELGGARRHADGHVVVHLAVDRPQARLVSAGGAVTAEEVAVRARRLRLLGVRVVRAARLVMRGDRLLVVRLDLREDGERRGLGLASQDGGVDHRLRGGGGRARDLDLGRHAGVDVAEVVDLGVRRVRRDLERHLVRVGRVLRAPPVLAVEEERLVRVQAEAAVGTLGAIDVVLNGGTGGLTAQLGALACRPSLVLARRVRSARDVGEADRVVPVTCVRLVEGVLGARNERELGVDAVAAGDLVGAPLRRVRVPLHLERGGGRRARRAGLHGPGGHRVGTNGGLHRLADRRVSIALGRDARQRGVGLEPRRHLLGLAVLHVDDVPRQALGECHVLVLRARRRVVCSLVVLGQHLGHRHGVLVVRDHLPRERGELGRRGARHRHRHVVVHLAVDRLQALAVGVVGAGTAEEVLARAGGVLCGGVKGSNVVGAARVVKRGDRLLLIRHDTGVDGERRGLSLGGTSYVEASASRARDLDLGRHAGVDVAEVVDLVVRRGRRDVERHLVRVGPGPSRCRGPPVLAVEEFRLVCVEAEAALVGRHCGATDVVLDGGGSLPAQLGALARRPASELARRVRAARDVGEADRVIPVEWHGFD